MPHITKTSAAKPYAYHPASSLVLVKRVSSSGYWDGSSLRGPSGPMSSAELERSSSASKEEECDRYDGLALLADGARCRWSGRSWDMLRGTILAGDGDQDQSAQ